MTQGKYRRLVISALTIANLFACQLEYRRLKGTHLPSQHALELYQTHSSAKTRVLSRKINHS